MPEAGSNPKPNPLWATELKMTAALAELAGAAAAMATRAIVPRANVAGLRWTLFMTASEELTARGRRARAACTRVRSDARAPRARDTWTLRQVLAEANRGTNFVLWGRRRRGGIIGRRTRNPRRGQANGRWLDPGTGVAGSTPEERTKRAPGYWSRGLVGDS